MTTSDDRYPDTELLELTGPIGYDEFENAPEWAKEALRAKLVELTTLSDDEFVEAAEHAIYESALVQRFRGNWEHHHCYATACCHQSELRRLAAGHAEECRDKTLYTEAYDNVVRAAGYPGLVRDPVPCECPDATTRDRHAKPENLTSDS